MTAKTKLCNMLDFCDIEKIPEVKHEEYVKINPEVKLSVDRKRIN